jgi:hypothetical protein
VCSSDLQGVASIEDEARAERMRQDADEFVRRIESLSARAAEQVRATPPGPDAFARLAAILNSVASEIATGGRHEVV